MTKVYKYIQLNDCEKIGRFENILLTNEIWLSKYNRLNDPMEGIYYTYSEKKSTRLLLSEKNKYLIGCFGSTLDNFTLWAYYADGFRGACIEIELDEAVIGQKIKYESSEDFNKTLEATNENLKHILTRKLVSWRNESELRVLIQDEDATTVAGKLKKVGQVTGVYFGINTSQKVVTWMGRLQRTNTIAQITCWGIISPEKIKEPITGNFDQIMEKLKKYQASRAKMLF